MALLESIEIHRSLFSVSSYKSRLLAQAAVLCPLSTADFPATELNNFRGP